MDWVDKQQNYKDLYIHRDPEHFINNKKNVLLFTFVRSVCWVV